MTKPRVKPLVWQPDSMKGSYPDRYIAKMPCGSGDYSIAGSRKQDKWQWFRNGHFVDGHQLHTPMPIEAAKAAAQADYEARILSALDLTPDPAVQALVEAARAFADIFVGQNPDWQPLVRLDRDAILALRAALAAFDKTD